MPKIIWSKHWLIRIDLLPGVQEKLHDYCVQLPALICTEEAGEGETPNPHVHMLASFDQDQPSYESKKTNNPGLIAKMKAHFSDTVFQSTDFAFTVWDQHGMNTGIEEYVCKGPYKGLKTEPIVKYKSPCFYHDVLMLHEAYWKVHKAILDKRDLKIKKEKQKMDDKMKSVDACRKLIDNYMQIDGVAVAPRHITYDYCCKAVIEHFKGKVNDHVAFPVVQALMYQYEPVATVATFQRRMQDKFKYLYEV